MSEVWHKIKAYTNASIIWYPRAQGVGLHITPHQLLGTGQKQRGTTPARDVVTRGTGAVAQNVGRTTRQEGQGIQPQLKSHLKRMALEQKGYLRSRRRIEHPWPLRYIAY